MSRFHWINDNIKIDFPVSRVMQNTMDEAEELDLANDIEYNAVADILDIMCKEAYVNKLLTKAQWRQICTRYPYYGYIESEKEGIVSENI